MDEEEEEERKDTFILQVFPSKEWMQTVITATNNGFTRAQNVKNMCVVNADELRRFVREKGIDREARLEVHVWRGEGACVKVETDGNYSSSLKLDQAYSKRFTKIFTEPPFLRKEVFSCDRLRGVLIVVTFIPTATIMECEKFKLLDYAVPIIPGNVRPFEISIYNRNDNNERVLLDAYIEEVNELNTQSKEPVLLSEPVDGDKVTGESLIHEEDRIVFIAKLKDETKKMIGYCACVLLKNNDPGHTKSPSRDIMVNNKFGEYEELKDRYFIGVDPVDLFKIEGLSAHPDHKNQDIGLILLWEALRFISDDRVKEQPCFANVTHIVSHAVSAITKRLLTYYFGFRYHGSNQFLNQTFIETLSFDTKAITEMVDTLADIVDTFIFLISHDKECILTTKAGEPFTFDQKDVKNRNPVAILVNSVINLYHLFYLIAKSTELFNEDATEKGNGVVQLAGGFIMLFEEIQCIIGECVNDDEEEVTPKATKKKKNKATGKRNRKRIPVKDQSSVLDVLYPYIERNIEALHTFVRNKGIGDSDPFKTNNTIYTNFKNRSDGKNRLKKFGFLYLNDENSKVKINYSEGYDVIFQSYSVISIISDLLRTEATQLPKNTFVALSDLILTDIEKAFNYSIPSHQTKQAGKQSQLDRIYTILQNIASVPSFLASISSEGELNSLLEAIVNQKEKVEKNYKLGEHMMKKLYDDGNASMDTCISFNELKSTWQACDAKVKAKIMRTTTAQSQPQQQDMVIDEIYATEPPIPLEKNDRYRDINELFKLLRPTNFVNNLGGGEHVVVFRGVRYRFATIMNHFVKLMNLRDANDGRVAAIATKPKKGIGMEVELTDHQVYHKEEFIDIEDVNRYTIDANEGGILNQEFI